MKYLLDTCTISELLRPRPDARVLEFINRLHDSQLYFSAVTIGEIEKGISLMGEEKRKREVEQWLAEIEGDFGDNILPIDREIARTWGQMTAECRKQGIALCVPDGLIAATAKLHSLYLVTLNVKDFLHTGVKLLQFS